MKIIILKYSFIPLFGSLSGREWTLFSQIFTPPPLPNWKELKGK